MAKADDPELDAVVAELWRLDPDGARTARVLRFTYDQIYDGTHTGRYSWGQLAKTEKTHFGSLVEINLQREFGLADGTELDFRIAGVDVDCKWSQRDGGWMLPPEAWGKLCVLLTGDDETSQWSMGVVRATPEHLSDGRNRDMKKTLNSAGRDAISWVFRKEGMPENILIRLDFETLQAILGHQRRSGQSGINELFRRVTNRPVGRGVVATVAQQDDYMKRVRANGGARSQLRPEGILVLGDYSDDQAIALALGLTPPTSGETMSVRLCEIDGPSPGAAQIDGRWYRLCGPDEEPTRPSPTIPKRSRRDPGAS